LVQHAKPLGSFTHLTADFLGVSQALLRDAPLISGLLVAAAGAAGFSSAAAPTSRQRGQSGVTAVLLLDTEGCHFAAHAFPDRELLLLDVLVPADRDAGKAVDVFVRRLAARKVNRGQVNRG
jgi:S-adenosylmethionine/arginine decarboxylase-like enzyme